MEHTNHRPTWKTLLAFSIIYFVWGSTFLGIRVGVREVPPLILAAMRFSVAGLVLFGWVLARGERAPSLREWRSASILGHGNFPFRLWVAVLGGAARAFGHRRGDAGHDSSVYGAL